jgi:hypothetical protein
MNSIEVRRVCSLVGIAELEVTEDLLETVWIADIPTEGAFPAGQPHLPFEQAGYGQSNPIRSWDISLDGHRFLMVRLEERKPQPVTEMILVQNWLEELKRLVPVKWPEKELAKGYERQVQFDCY